MTRGDVVLLVDGVEVTGLDGDTVAAVLVRAGRPAWRLTRHGSQPRGLFCGIGACHDCLVTVDGVRGVRACLAPVRAGSVVTTAARPGEDMADDDTADDDMGGADG